MIARLTAAARRLQLLATLYIIALARAAWPHVNVGCKGEGCQQGHRPERCNCGLSQRWATTSDPLAWVRIEPPAPQNARHIPRQRLPWRLRDWVVAAVVVAAVLGANALADTPSTALLRRWM